jgi:hypothetical protein
MTQDNAPGFVRMCVAAVTPRVIALQQVNVKSLAFGLGRSTQNQQRGRSH